MMFTLLYRNRPASTRGAVRRRYGKPTGSFYNGGMPEETYFRSGDRAAAQSRVLKLTPGFVQTPEGSVLIEVGHTRVLCNATVDTGVPGWMRNSGRGWVTAEYGMLPRATLTRTARESERGKIGG